MKTKQCKVCLKYKPQCEFQPTSRKTCNACAAIHRKARYRANIEQELAARKLYEKTHRKQIAARKRKYRATEQGKIKREATERKYRQSPKGRATMRKRAAQWSKTEKGRISGRIRCARRRALLLKAPGVFTAPDWVEILEKQKHHCKYCGEPFTKAKPATIDHVIPLTKGGAHSPENIVAACRSCNSKKWNHLLTK